MQQCSNVDLLVFLTPELGIGICDVDMQLQQTALGHLAVLGVNVSCRPR